MSVSASWNAGFSAHSDRIAAIVAHQFMALKIASPAHSISAFEVRHITKTRYVTSLMLRCLMFTYIKYDRAERNHISTNSLITPCGADADQCSRIAYVFFSDFKKTRLFTFFLK